MNLSSYDKALETKLKQVFPNVVNSNEDKALEDSEDDKAQVEVPMISFWRLNNNLSTTNTFVANRRGRVIGSNRETGSTLVHQTVEVDITYQIDIWSDRRYEVDAIFGETLLYLLQEPNLLVSEPNTPEPFSFPIDISETNTDAELSQFSDTGAMYRQVISIEVKGAQLIFPKAGKLAKDINIRLVDFKGGDLVVDD